MPDSQRILIVRLSHLGDCVRTLPLFHALRQRFPAAELGWAIESQFASLIEGLPGLDQVLRFDRNGGLRAWPRLAKELRRFGADWTIDAQGNTKSAVVSGLSRARRTLGWNPADWRERLLAKRVLDAWPAPLGLQHSHAVERVLHLAHFAVADAGAPGEMTPRYDLDLTAAERERGFSAWRALRPASGARPVVHQLGREGDVRSLPYDATLALLRELERAQHPTIVMAGDLERDLARRLEAELSANSLRTFASGNTSLRELAAVYAAASDDGAIFVGADSGPLHLANAMGLPCRGLVGPYDPARFGLWPRPNAETTQRTELSADPPPTCAPCNAKRCTHPQGNVCMQSIDPHSILATL